MRRSMTMFLAASLLCALPLCAQDPQPQSLGDIAREARKAKEDRDKTAAKPAKVFNEDNFHSSAAGKADLAQLASPTASPTERMVAARRAIARGEQLLDTLDPMTRTTLAETALQGQNVDFPGRRAWEEKLFAAKEHYVSHGRELFRETNALLNNMEALSSGGKADPNDPRMTDISHRALQLMQDANKTDADFQAIVLEGQDFAKRAANH
jgi:hypothetical protein